MGLREVALLNCHAGMMIDPLSNVLVIADS
jgi:hypothetical protein